MRAILEDPWSNTIFATACSTPAHTDRMPHAGARSLPVTGNGGSIHDNDQLLVTIKGSKSLHMRLTVEKVRHLINPPGQWIAVAKGPVFDELAIHQWKVHCDSCAAELNFEFMVESKLLSRRRNRPLPRASRSWAGKPMARSTSARSAEKAA